MKDLEFPVVTDLHYHTILNTMTRKQLLEICDYIKVVNRSNLKKGDLKSILHSDIYLYLAKYLNAMNDGQLKILYILLENNFLSLETYPFQYLHFFLQLGIAYPVTFDDKQGLFIPKEIKHWIIKHLTPTLMERFDRNNRVVSFVYHCMNAYGLMDYQSFFYLYQTKYPDDDIFHEFQLILELESDFNKQYVCEYGYFYDQSLQERLPNFLTIRKLYNDIAYYHFNDDEIIRNDYQDEPIILKLKKPLIKLTEDAQEQLVSWSLKQLNQGYTVYDLIEQLQTLEVPKRTLKRFVKQLEKQFPYLRLWTLKGNRFIDLEHR